MSLDLIDDVKDLLATDRFGQALRGFEEVDSTNVHAGTWAQNGASEGSVVVAEYQTAGRGRHGRTWSADKSQNLLFSVVLRPRLAADRLGLITVAASVAVAETIDHFVAPHRSSIKWPNDVLLEGRKTCGMLLETSMAGAQTEAVVLGVGLNVNQTHFPDSLEDTATSLRLTTGRPVPRPPLLARLLQALEDRYDTVQSGGADVVRSTFHERLTRLHAPTTLRFTGSDQTITGTVQGITDAGALRLETEQGMQTVHAGEVTSQESEIDER